MCVRRARRPTGRRAARYGSRLGRRWSLGPAPERFQVVAKTVSKWWDGYLAEGGPELETAPAPRKLTALSIQGDSEFG
jgi:hypothetical protein